MTASSTAQRSEPRASSSSRQLAARILLHPDVSEKIDQHANLRRRLGIILRQIAATGRTAIVKGCNGRHVEWLRSPMGGNSGNQFYLWFRVHHRDGNRALYLRDVRHHDDWSPIDEGQDGDYIPLGRDEIQDPAWIDSPWTNEQTAFADARGDVDLLIGAPGAGKTSSLWERVVRSRAAKTLYVSWSRDLTSQAERYFDAFLEDGSTVNCLHYAGLLAQLTGQQLPPGVIRNNLKRFEGLTGFVPPALRKYWDRNYSAAFSELRAHYFGLSPLAQARLRTNGGPWRMDDDSFRKLFAKRPTGGPLDADACLSLINALSVDVIESCFQDLSVASNAIDGLRKNGLPDGLDAYEIIAVDEAQDLTLLEIYVLITLCKAIGAESGRVPRLLIAGDEGQTVRPTGFDWGRLSTVLSRDLGKPEAYRLTSSLRCPEGIANVLDQASSLYQGISKSQRPGKQQRNPEAEATNATVVLAMPTEDESLPDILEKLIALDRCAIVTPEREVPDWVPENLRDSVLTPEVVKGLEYQTVVVLDPGYGLARLGDFKQFSADAPEARMQIDRLRVCLSRATETLVGLLPRTPSLPGEDQDAWRLRVEADQVARVLFKQSGSFIGGNDALECIDVSASSPEERVVEKLNLARSALDEQPSVAMRAAIQAVRMLGDAGLPNGVQDPGLRRETQETFLETLVVALIEHTFPLLFDEDGVESLIRLSITELGGDNVSAIVRPIQALCEINCGNALGCLPSEPDPQFVLYLVLLDLVKQVDQSSVSKEWFVRGMSDQAGLITQDAFAALAQEDQGGARTLASPRLRDWLLLAGCSPDWVDRERAEILDDCFYNMLEGGDFTSAERLVKDFLDAAPDRLGLVAEKAGKYAVAARHYRAAEMPQKELYCLREMGQIEKTLPMLTPKDPLRGALGWVLELERLAKPKGKIRGLTDGEAKRLAEALKVLEAIAKRATPNG